MTRIFRIIILILLSSAAAHAGKDVSTYKSIEFRGIHYLSKYEIIENADIRTDGENILVNMDSMERVLNDMQMVRSFKISEENNKLIISITENKPIFLLSMNDADNNTLLELDADYNIISVNKAHAANMPLVVISKDDVVNNGISSRVRNFLRLIDVLKSSGLRVMNEIAEVDYSDIFETRIVLKGRKTVFVIKPDKEGFIKMNYAAGYFDSIRYYPRAFTIYDDMGILE